MDRPQSKITEFFCCCPVVISPSWTAFCNRFFIAWSDNFFALRRLFRPAGQSAKEGSSLPSLTGFNLVSSISMDFSAITGQAPFLWLIIPWYPKLYRIFTSNGRVQRDFSFICRLFTEFLWISTVFLLRELWTVIFSWFHQVVSYLSLFLLCFQVLPAFQRVFRILTWFF